VSPLPTLKLLDNSLLQTLIFPGSPDLFFSTGVSPESAFLWERPKLISAALAQGEVPWCTHHACVTLNVRSSMG
jgi:hypothetical protein